MDYFRVALIGLDSTRFSSQWPKCPLNALDELRNGLKTKRKLPQAMRIETITLLETKEFCGAARSSM